MEVKTHRSVGRAVAVLGAAAGLLIAAAPAMANTVQITGSMEGAIQISNGDHVAAGYQFSVQGAHPAMTVQMANASVVFQGKCSNGGTDTLTVPLSAGPYQIAANDNGPHPGTNEQQPVSFQGSVTANVCGGTGTLDASSGATFSADLQSDVTTNQVQVQFHYRDPAAKGKGNYDCMASSSASLGSDVCGASWSGAVRLVPDALPATPVLATSASSGVVGQSIQDVATLSGGNNPTGTITWKLYGPGDSTCSSAIRTFTDSTISGDGNYTSPSFATTSAGTYRWVASYGGDSNNVAVSGKCNDAGENSTVTPASPGIVTRVTPSSATVGDVIKDTATLSGGDNPTGSITWHLYSDPGCTSLVDTITVPVNGDATYTVSPGFTTSAPGVYYWVAKYSGDSNNEAATTKCGDPSEETPVSSPGIQVQKLDSAPCADLADVTQPPGITPCNGTWSSFTHGIITVNVPYSGSYSIPIDYQIRVTNTGSTPLALSLNDPLCDPGTISGPTLVSGTLNGTTLSAGGTAFYTCTHTLTQNDPDTNAAGQPFTNAATVTGTPPSGPPVHGSDIVTVHRQPLPPPPPPAGRRFCKSVKTGKKVSWPRGTPKPKACTAKKHPRSRKPKHPSGFTG